MEKPVELPIIAPESSVVEVRLFIQQAVALEYSLQEPEARTISELWMSGTGERFLRLELSGHQRILGDQYGFLSWRLAHHVSKDDVALISTRSRQTMKMTWIKCESPS